MFLIIKEFVIKSKIKIKDQFMRFIYIDYHVNYILLLVIKYNIIKIRKSMKRNIIKI